jgi:hypothetical protein
MEPEFEGLKHPGGRPTDPLRHHKDALAIALSFVLSKTDINDTMLAKLVNRIVEGGEITEIAGGIAFDAPNKRERGASLENVDAYTRRRLRGKANVSANDMRRIEVCVHILCDLFLSATFHIAGIVASQLTKPGKLSWEPALVQRVLFLAELLHVRHLQKYHSPNETIDRLRYESNRPSVVVRSALRNQE